MLLFRADPFGGTHELLPCGLLGGDLVELLRSKSSASLRNASAEEDFPVSCTRHTPAVRQKKAKNRLEGILGY
jgi:hypothetical protein